MARRLQIPKLLRFDWKYALGEIALLFIGITLAIAFNNWNESRKQRGMEKETLLEIKSGIEKDMRDMDINMEGYEYRIKAFQTFIDLLEAENLPQSDTLPAIINSIYGFSHFITNTAPYETLKSRGLEIITNDSLRLTIAEYYDVTQEWILINESRALDQYEKYIEQILVEQITFRKGTRSRFTNLAALKESNQVLQALYLVKSGQTALLQLYTHAKQQAEHIIQQIDIEAR